jgi:hypothetical protein
LGERMSVMLNTISRRLILSHLIPVLLVVPLMGFAFEFLLGTHALSSTSSNAATGTICAHFQSLAAPFAGLIILGLVFGSIVAWFLARTMDRPLQQLFKDIESLAGDKEGLPLRQNGPQEIQNLLGAVNMLAQRRLEPEMGYQSSDSRPVLLSLWLPQVLENWRKVAEARHLNWDAIIPANLPDLMMHADQVKPMIDCLLQKTIYSAHPGGSVSVRFMTANEGVCISISDSMLAGHSELFANQALNDTGSSRLIVENAPDRENAFMFLFSLRET